MTVPTGLRRARLAATVLLLRDGDAGLEVWAQERAATMRYFAGVTVFPGGGVDHRDHPSDAARAGRLWVGTPVTALAGQLNMSPEQTHAVVFAAVRELFEETGTLLAVHADGLSTVTDVSPYHSDRLALASHRLSLTDMLLDRDLRIRSDLLRPWARWVGGDSGDDERHWFDNSAFLAVAPAGQHPDGDTPEADDANWFSPSQLLDGWHAGLVRLAIPTWAQLGALADCADVAGALRLAGRADLTPVIGDPVHDPRYREYFHAIRTERF